MRRRAIAALLLAAAAALPAAAHGQDTVPLVRVPFPQDERNLTPYTFELGYPLMTLVYDTLMWRDARGVPRPWLARSVSRSGGGRTITVRLRDGARWHDGRPVTAADVAFTFEHVAARPHPRFTPQLRNVESVAAPDDGTVVIRLREPSLGFLDQPLADLPILPRHIWDGLPPNRLAPAGLPVGSGPYRLVEHERGVRYVFRANRRYFRGRPAVSNVAVPIIRRADDMTLALERRQIDAIPVPLGPDAAARLDDLGVRVAKTPSYVGTVLMLNTRRPPFDRPDMRRAVARAIDVDRVVLNLSDDPTERGAVPATHGVLHPASRWAPQAALDTFDEPRARVAFVELNGPPIRVLAPSNDELRLEAGRQVVLALRRAGARARLVERGPRALARDVGQDGFAPTFEAAIWSSPPLASHDPDFLRVVFGDPASAPLNYTGYASGRFARLAQRVATAVGVRRRLTAVAAELRRLQRDAPVVPLFFFDGRFAYRPAVHDGWVAVRGSGILDKRSFLRTRRARGTTAPGGSPLAPPSRDAGFELGWLGVAALALGGLALLGLLAAMAPRVRRR